jgi:hypothetical protein
MPNFCNDLAENSKEENSQETCRELARNLPNKTQNHKRCIAFFKLTATATNAELHNQGAAVLAPLGALG